MPSDVVETATYTPTIKVPNDGEGATKASLLTNFVQGLANRFAYIKAIVDVIGVHRVHTVADGAALKAITGMATSDMRWMTGVGPYFYDASAIGSESLPWTVAPTIGTGLWVHGLALAKTLYLAEVSGGKVVQPVPNRIVLAGGGNVPDILAGILYTTVNTTPQTVIALSFPAAANGDTITATVTAQARMTAGAGLVRLDYSHTDGAVDGIASASVREVTSTSWVDLTMQCAVEPTGSGEARIVLKAAGAFPTGGIELRRVSHTFVHVRP